MLTTHWQEGFQRLGYCQSVFLEIKKAESLIFKNLLLKLWIIHIFYTVFPYKPTETTGEGLNYIAGYIDGEEGKGMVRVTRVS